MPKLLAFDTSTDQLCVGVRRGDAVWSRQAPGGAQASATLIPLVQALLAEAGLALRELDAICFGRGPGSFTGLRTACSVAQGLAYGAGLPVLPVDTLHAVAEEARLLGGATRIVAVLDARMDEVYTAAFAFDGTPHPLGDAAGEARLMAPEDVVVPPGWTLAGNAFAAYGERLPAGVPRQEALPTAAAMLRLAPSLLAAGAAVPADRAWPLYVRDKVAQTTAERAAAKEAQAVRP
ncbi:tRNA threonylcarbamoyladenosine biosynthesis protein TsaB [Xylophilus ampelinus]|nr:tRNA (adenosine(37)-N6)-threonylcarbamoyltransferase complex dimerization subunit type 1 TsaB [Variovorax sp.]VTY23916.1 tRNA threonylcarbamoyladenosine biosynthesis protein TsaB [Xylophilus ampelinus]